MFDQQSRLQSMGTTNSLPDLIEMQESFSPQENRHARVDFGQAQYLQNSRAQFILQQIHLGQQQSAGQPLVDQQTKVCQQLQEDLKQQQINSNNTNLMANQLQMNQRFRQQSLQLDLSQPFLGQQQVDYRNEQQQQPLGFFGSLLPNYQFPQFPNISPNPTVPLEKLENHGRQRSFSMEEFSTGFWNNETKQDKISLNMLSNSQYMIPNKNLNNLGQDLLFSLQPDGW
jgi:hypothetical protein